MDAEDYPETSAGPANDDTSIVDPATHLGWLAWSDDDEGYDDEPGWRRTFAEVSMPLFVLAIVAFAAAVACLIWLEMGRDQNAPPRPLLPSTMPASDLPPIASEALAPPTKVADPAPPMTTVTITPSAKAPSEADLDEQFLNEVTSAGLNITNVRDAIGGAHKVCEYLAAGHSEADAARLGVHNNPSLTESDARVVVNAAVRVYCPEQAD